MADQFFWYQLMTPDPGAAQEFYGEVVGWTPRPIGPDYTVLETGGHGIGGIARLGEDMVRAGGKPIWLAYIQVDEVAKAVEAVRADGGTVYHEPEDIGVGIFALVADRQGAPFMLMTPRPPEGATPDPRPGAPGFAPEQPGHGAWHELHTTDWQAAFDFYVRHFGWREDGRHEMGPMGTYLLFAADSGQVGGMFNSPGAAQPFWLVYFRVDSVDAAVERIKAAGGRIANGPHDVPGGARVVQAIDPQGAMFALTSPK